MESMANVKIYDESRWPADQREEVFTRMERVVLSRIDEFIPHYLVKLLCSFTKAGQGSGELYDQLIERILSKM